MMYFSEPRAPEVPLFTSSKILPLNMLYVETVSSIMFDVSCLTVPTNISNLLIKADEKHNHGTRLSSSSCNFYINRSRLNQNHGSFARFGAKLWNSIKKIENLESFDHWFPSSNSIHPSSDKLFSSMWSNLRVRESNLPELERSIRHIEPYFSNVILDWIMIAIAISVLLIIRFHFWLLKLTQ